MASLFRPRRPEPPPPGQPEGSSTWLSGIVSGAGRMISFVFRSDTPSPSSSSYSSDSEPDDDEGTPVSPKEPDAVNQVKGQSGKPLEVFKDSIDGSLAIVSKVEPKHAIEQLLMQETFTRDECIKLTNIIESRVVDFSNADAGEGVRNELPSKTSGNAITYQGGWRSLNHTINRPELMSYSPHSPNVFSPGSSTRLLRSPEFHSMAIMEAKKWLEEKKLSSNSKSDVGCEPGILNTDIPHYNLEGARGSPVDVAKCYMQTLSPWQSPPLSTNGFGTAQPGRMHSYKDETPKEDANNNSLSSFKVLKRKGSGSQEALDETRRVRLKLTDYLSEFNTFRHDSSVQSSENVACQNENVACQNPLEPVRRVEEVLGTSYDLSPLQDAPSLDGPFELSSKFPVEDHYLDIALGSSNKRTSDENDTLKTGIGNSTDIVSDAEEAATERQSTHKNLGLETLYPVVGNEFMSDDPATKFNDNQDVEEPPQVKETVNGVSVPHDSFILGLASRKHDDTRLPKCRKGSGKAQKETNGLMNNTPGDSVRVVHTNSNVEDHHQTNSSIVDPAFIVSKRTLKTTTRGPKASKVMSRSQTGTATNPVKQELNEPEPSMSETTRGKKAVGRPKRGRGRGK